MMKILKETSGLAIFSFLLAIFWWSIPFIETFYTPLLFYTHLNKIPCEAISYGCGVAALSGIISLIYIKKTGLKGKWFAILAIILGIIGLPLGVCL